MLVEHSGQYDVAPVESVLGVQRRVVHGRRLGNARQKGSFGKREVGGRLREIAARGGFDAIGTITVVDGVQVHVQDFVFGVHLLELGGDVNLAHLALHRDVVHLVGKDGVAHELLGDRGRALETAARQVVHERAHDAVHVDTAVLVEAGILGCKSALDEVRANLFEIDRLAVLQLKTRQHRSAVRGVHIRRQRHVERIGTFVIG